MGYYVRRKCKIFQDSSSIYLEEQLDEAIKAVDLVTHQKAPVSRDIIYCLLQACTKKKNLAAVRRVYSLTVSSGLDSVTVLGDHLIRLFTMCGSLLDAKHVFFTISKPTVFTWNAILSAHVNLEESQKAFDLYHNMQQQGIKPDKITFLCISKACKSIKDLKQCRLIHNLIVGRGFEMDVCIGNTLVNMYATCGSLGEAHKVFNLILPRNEVSWQVMVAGYIQYGINATALALFEKMQLEGIRPGKVMFLYILKACGSIGVAQHGRLIHGQINKWGHESDMVIGSSLLDMYARCGSLDEARRVFDGLPHQNVVTWGAMIAAYVRHGHCFTALELFEKMQQDSIRPDEVVFSCILRACGIIKAIGKGKLIHEQILKCGLQGDTVLGNTLVDMYAKCGSLEEANKTFNGLSDKDVVSWGVIITGYVQHGYALPALELFKRMQCQGIKPSKVILLCILKACGSAGAIKQGRLIHEHIIKDDIESDIQIGNILIDMYAKCGSLDEAHLVFNSLPNPDVVSWGAMIAGYAHHGCDTMTRQCLRDMERQGLKPDALIYTSVLMAHSHAGRLDEGHFCFDHLLDDHDLAPDIEHYNGMIDLLGRAGCLNEADDLLQSMPTSPDTVGLRSLLSGCRTYGNIELGRRCFDQLIELNPKDASGYVLVANIYADSHLWNNASTLQERKKIVGALKRPGRAWIEIDNNVLEFIVGGYDHPQSEWIYSKLSRLNRAMKGGYMPVLDSVLEILAEDKEDVLSGHCKRLAMATGWCQATELSAFGGLQAGCWPYASNTAVI